jgi:hypothetical protein
VANRTLFLQRCVNACGGDPGCRRIDCCHECLLYVKDACTNDGSYAFLPRYFARLARA